MPWTKKNFPGPMKSLPSDVRDKAIRIANALIAEKRLMEQEFIIAVSISRAREWALERGRKFEK